MLLSQCNGLPEAACQERLPAVGICKDVPQAASIHIWQPPRNHSRLAIKARTIHIWQPAHLARR